MKSLTIPISTDDINSLHAGDSVLLNGVIMTARDAAHKWLVETFIHLKTEPSEADQETYHAIRPLLDNGVIYHCGPVVAGGDGEPYRFVAAGPTTSIREEPYQGDVIHHLNLRGVIGKGGMGPATLAACAEAPAVYFHAVGGAATLLAASVKHVVGVYKLEFGIPEAMWAIEVENFPVVVTMDAHHRSLHEVIEQHSKETLQHLIGKTL